LTRDRWSILLKVRKVIGNLWTLGFQVVFSHWHSGGFDVMIGKDHPQIVHCSDRDELRFLVASVYCNLEFLGPSEIGQNVERLLALGRSVRQRLESRFTTDEIRHHSTGGWPGFKEVALHCLIRRFHPQEVIETGVAQGVSSVFILDALQQNGSGHLTSIDLPNFGSDGYFYEDGTTKDPAYVKEDLGVGWLVPDTLRNRWTLTIGASQDILPTLPTHPQLFLHDSQHSYEHMMFEFEWAWSRMPRGGLLVSDDISRNGAFSDFLTAHESETAAICTERVGIALRLK
jgi:hypothetical protein